MRAVITLLGNMVKIMGGIFLLGILVSLFTKLGYAEYCPLYGEGTDEYFECQDRQSRIKDAPFFRMPGDSIDDVT